MTLDELWFYLWTNHDIVQVQSGQHPSEMVKHMMRERKMMVTIVWNPQSFYLIDALPEDQKFQFGEVCNRVWRIAEPDFARVSSFMRRIHSLTPPERLSNFAWKIAWEWRHKCPTRAQENISHIMVIAFGDVDTIVTAVKKAPSISFASHSVYKSFKIRLNLDISEERLLRSIDFTRPMPQIIQLLCSKVLHGSKLQNMRLKLQIIDLKYYFSAK
jgi:hypothetical protein